jgi:hypothetical protein
MPGFHFWRPHPGTPPDSMWLANVTSSLHTSNCHLRKPRTPHRTFPVWMPILISTLNPLDSRTNLEKETRDTLVDLEGYCHETEIRTKVLHGRLPARWHTAKCKLHGPLYPLKPSGNYSRTRLCHEMDWIFCVVINECCYNRGV